MLVCKLQFFSRFLNTDPTFFYSSHTVLKPSEYGFSEPPEIFKYFLTRQGNGFRFNYDLLLESLSIEGRNRTSNAWLPQTLRISPIKLLAR